VLNHEIWDLTVFKERGTEYDDDDDNNGLSNSFLTETTPDLIS